MIYIIFYLPGIIGQARKICSVFQTNPVIICVLKCHFINRITIERLWSTLPTKISITTSPIVNSQTQSNDIRPCSRRSSVRYVRQQEVLFQWRYIDNLKLIPVDSISGHEFTKPWQRFPPDWIASWLIIGSAILRRYSLFLTPMLSHVYSNIFHPKAQQIRVNYCRQYRSINRSLTLAFLR